MPILPRLRSFIRNRLQRGRIERDLDDELAAYVSLAAEEKMRDGVDRERAYRDAWMEIGGKESVKERVRQRRVGHALDNFFQDVAFSIRLLVQRPGFTLLAASTLALGIGTTTAVYAVVDGVLLRSLPYPEPDRLVFVGATARDGHQHFSPPDFVELREQARSFDALGALVGRTVATLSVDGVAVPAEARQVTTNFLSIFGARPHIGRSFRSSDRDFVSFEDRGNASLTLPTGVMILGYETWRERFAADPEVLGRLVELDLQPYQIIGVAPPGFQALLPDDGDYQARSRCGRCRVWILLACRGTFRFFAWSAASPPGSASSKPEPTSPRLRRDSASATSSIATVTTASMWRRCTRA